MACLGVGLHIPSSSNILASSRSKGQTSKATHAIRFNEHLAHDGSNVFEHACRMGLEGIVSKPIDAPYRSGPSKTWLKSKNPLSEAVRRERMSLLLAPLRPADGQ